jgi:4-hydroxybenzoate polyprenyltransferase
VVLACYGICAALLAAAALQRGLAGPVFWPIWALATAGMVREAVLLRRPDPPRSAYGRHFSRQVLLGGLLLLGLILASPS